MHPLLNLAIAVIPKLLDKKKDKPSVEEAVKEVADAVHKAPLSTGVGVTAAATTLYIISPTQLNVWLPMLSSDQATLGSAIIAVVVAAIGVFWKKPEEK